MHHLYMCPRDHLSVLIKTDLLPPRDLEKHNKLWLRAQNALEEAYAMDMDAQGSSPAKVPSYRLCRMRQSA